MTASSVQTNGKKYKVIGTRPIRHDGIEKVTGEARYGNDSHFPNMLYGKYVRSPHAHARIISIDASKAEAYPGVTAVVTSADMAEVADKIEELGEDVVNLRYLAANILAFDKALFHGHAIAAVAATSPHVAEEAAALVEVEYEVLEPVLDAREAMQPDAPILLQELRTDELGKSGDVPTNVARHFRHERGDLEAGFAAADVVVEREFETKMVHQGYIEPQASVVEWKANDYIEVYTSSQGPWQIREAVAELTGRPVSKVRVTPMEIGGGFGGKFTAYTDLPAALLSRRSGNRPVKMSLTRTEVLQSTGPTSGSHIRVKIGATNDGKITAAAAELIYEAGAYPGSPVGAGSGVILGPYNLDVVRIDGYDVVVNKPRTGAYRAPGGTNAAFASESVMDEVAEKLDMDPLEFRRINAPAEGIHRPDGPVFPRIGCLETVEAAMNHPHYSAPLEGKYRGRGVASGFWFNGAGPTAAVANVDDDGRINLSEGSADIGGTRTSMAMQLAETLGISAEDVDPHVVDTESLSYTGGTGGSSVTHKTGVAAFELGNKLIDLMRKELADFWDVEEDGVTFDDGSFAHNGTSLPFKQAAKALREEGVSLIASMGRSTSGAGPAFGTHIVDVEVDPDTGKVEVLRYTAVQDVGTAIHPAYVEGQIQGGVVQGIGWGLNEEYVYDDSGRLLNSSLLDYRMPTALDLPMIDTVLVEVPNPNHPYGVRGVGEVPIVPPAAALANAIYRATGQRLRDLPMSPPKVAASLQELNPA